MTAQVRLVPITSAHEAAFLAAVARSRQLHAPWVSPPATPEAFQAFSKRLSGELDRGFVIVHPTSGALLGCIAITQIVRGAFQSGYLGYYAFAGHERQGYMRAGLSLAVRTAFDELKLHRLEANIQPTNLASIALVRTCGFKQEGFSPRYLKIGGRWRDHERWAILAR